MDTDGTVVRNAGAEQETDTGRAGARRPVFELDDVWRVYGTGDQRVEACRGVNLQVYEGDFVAIMGPSGSGKSTLLHLIGLLDKPTGGEIRYRGIEVSTLSDSRISGVRNREVGFVFQAFHLLPRQTALGNVELPLVYRGMAPSKRRELALAALDLVGLSDRVHHRRNQLSGGQVQRVAIARALASEPAVLLADEPTGNLDSRTGVEIMELLTRLNRELGITIILITHEADVAAYADRQYRMLDGELIDVTDVVDLTDGTRAEAGDGTATAPVVEAAHGGPVVATGDSATPAATSRAPALAGDAAPEVAPTAAAVSASRMRPGDVVRMAFSTLSANRLRTALTSLGVIIGVMAVVLLVALGAGARNVVTDQIEGLGSNLVIAFPGAREFAGGARPIVEFESPMTVKDVDALRGILGPDTLVSGATQTGVTLGGRAGSTTARVSGVTEDHLDIVDWQVSSGRFFDPAEYARGERVAVISQDLAERAVPGDPLGQQVTISGSRFEVIGVLPVSEADLSFSLPGTEREAVAFVPLPAMQRLVGSPRVDRLFLQTDDSSEVPVVVALTEDYLIRTYPDSQFEVADQEEILDIIDTILNVLTLTLAGIAAISLVVGGIGIMNVTLVGVTERTREIGVRRATGARSRHVLVQFLLEAIVTSAVGGLIGLSLAVLGARAIANRSPIPAEITGWAVMLAILVSGFTGVFFGVWPARRAARLDPVEALRHE